MNSVEFENALHADLAKKFPFAVLPNARLFRPSYAERRNHGFEMDNVLHIEFEGSDYIIVIEAKNQPVREVEGQWQVTYQKEPKCARRQLQEHIGTLREYVEPLSRNVDLRFIGIVVSSADETQPKALKVSDSEQYFVRSRQSLMPLLENQFNLQKKPERAIPEVLRLSQSGFLELFRLGVPLQLLGHPEIHTAIRYVERCRRSLDETIFQHFSPSSDQWAINGSAGMGKSVLLGYAACVLACGHELEHEAGKPRLRSAAGRFTSMKFDPEKGSLGVFAMTQRQLDNLRFWFEHFSKFFRDLDPVDEIRFRRPEFHLCRTMSELEDKPWSAVLLDEAHDIQENPAKKLVFRHKRDGFYLMLACDRHQKLRLAGDDARIIEGLDFSSRTKRLRQIYRNPSAVYMASLALMFRWFAAEGPKILPTKEELEGAFGFKVEGTIEEGYSLALLNDAHPANSWSNTVASFPSATVAYNSLSLAKLGQKEVLWVRFSGENDEFDYEKLSAFTYHNFRTEEAERLNDKYIKGQDFPIVVIEGFPSFMDRYQVSDSADGQSDRSEKKMWKYRRELYLCASRATCFLYFICTNAVSAEGDNIRQEIGRLTNALGSPVPNEVDRQGGRTWKISLARTSEANRRKLSIFTEVALTGSEAIAAAPTLESPAQASPPVVSAAAAIPPQTVAQPQIPILSVAEQKRQALNLFDPPTRSVEKPRTVANQPEHPIIPPQGEPLLEPIVEPLPIFVLSGPASVKDVAERLEIKPFKVIADLMSMKILVSNMDKQISEEQQRKLAEKRGFQVQILSEREVMENKLADLRAHFHPQAANA